MFQGIKKLFGGKKEEGQILAPVAGQAVPLSEVPDPAFAQEILGKGVAILPSENEFKAPASGEVTVLFETGHAVSIRTESGADVIVHIGLDTVNLKGQFFITHVKQGDTVKAGDLLITTLLSPGAVAGITGHEAAPAFGKIVNQFVGILSGLIGSACYNKYKTVKLPDALAFFSGKRAVAIFTAIYSIVAALVLFVVWPLVYGGLVALGEAFIGMGAVGAGIYAFFNRLLIPFGLHHALNSVFWFDVAGISDLSNFWGNTGVYGQTGMYMTGFFPFMMFGLPAACIAMYQTAKPGKKKIVYGLLASAAFCSFFTGVTEPIEFSFMFLAPGLYVVHALLAGITAGITVALPIRAGFSFSGGAVDMVLSSFTPLAENPWLLIPVGLAVGVLYYVVFRFAIAKFNLKTPGREDDDAEELKATLANNDYTSVAKTVLEGVGGPENVASIDNCITRLRLEVKDYTKVNEKVIKSAGVAGVMRPSKTSVQVIIGTQVQFVADEFKKLCK